MRLVAFIIISVCAFGVTGTTLLATEEKPSPLSVMQTARGTDDALPNEVLSSPVAKYDLGDPESARRVGSFHGGTYYFMRARERSKVCLVRHAPDWHVTALCPEQGALRTDPAWSAVLDRNSNRVVAVVVPDGYATVTVDEEGRPARSLAVRQNVAFVSTNRAARLVVSGAGQKSLASSIRRLPASIRR